MVTFLIIGGGIVLSLVILLGLITFFNSERTKKPRQKKPKNNKQKASNPQLSSDVVLETIEDGVIFVDNSKTIRTFNPGASRITGWPEQEAIGLDFHSVLKLVDAKGQPYQDSVNPFNKVFSQKTVVRDSRAVLVSRSNRYIALHISVSPLFDEQHNLSGAVAVFRDVSVERGEEQKRAEFISTASHEMRTPVAAIEGYLALAANPRVCTVDEKARGYLEKAHASTQHLGELFQDLLTSAKAEDGRLSSNPQVVELGNFLEKTSEDLRFAAQKKGLSLEYVIGSTGSTIDASDKNNKTVRPLYYSYVDPDRIREVITNLFDNAVKYTDTGKISIGLTGDSNVVQFYIKDSGAGIPREDIPHLFQKFYRVDNSATRTVGGTGLGLFICRKIVELYNGRIWVESELEKGSTFYVNLPRLDEQHAKQLQAQPNIPEAPKPSAPGATDTQV